MPIDNLGRLHLDGAKKTAITGAFDIIEATLLTVTQNLSSEERSRYGSVNETNKLLINNIRDYNITQRSLSSNDVDWEEFEADYQDRIFADTNEKRLHNILRMLTDFKIAHDFDNYQAALTDYQFSKYKANTKTPGFTEKVADIRQLFPNNGSGDGDTPAAAE